MILVNAMLLRGRLGNCSYISITFLEIKDAENFKAMLDRKLNKKAKRHGDRNSQIIIGDLKFNCVAFLAGRTIS